MPIHTLFVCEACGASSHGEASENAEGSQLLQQLQALHSNSRKVPNYKFNLRDVYGRALAKLTDGTAPARSR